MTESKAPATLPLQGIRVLDFSRIIAGPFCTQYLADLGADVIKVERPETGDDARAYNFPALWQGTGTMYLSFNRGKRSIALDLDREEDRDVARRLVAQADVLVENFRPGVMDKSGLGCEEMRALHPRLVYCSISGFGEVGPLAMAGANDLVAQASCGVMSLNPQADGRPQKVVPAMVDMFTGLNAALAIVAALHERTRTGVGTQVNTSLYESGIGMLSYFATTQLAAASQPPVKEDEDLGASITVPNQTFRASDGWMAIACSNEPMWRRLCDALQTPQLRDDPRYATNLARTRHQATLIPALEAVFATRTRDEWAQRLGDAKVSHSSVLSVDEVLAHPQTETLGMVVDIPHPEIEGFRMVRAPFRIGSRALAATLPPPRLDEHRAEILALAARGPDPTKHATEGA
ncbi:CaiB/BaiF CoA transferase family protein [Ramlibacter sp.]|uniref:CaiB/BaiF CoA transferase family protein n=1 Tax=Ramlibacter sp. TaxID=1917967 RepID=UPI003D09A938